MAIGSAASADFREGLGVSGGSRAMLEIFGGRTWAFLLFVGTVLGVLALASALRRSWAWHLTLVVYTIGVIGSFWQISVGIREAWISATVNAAVVALASTPGIRRAYEVTSRRGPHP